MTTPHAAAPAEPPPPTGGPDTSGPDPYAWVTPSVVTVLLLLVGPPAVFFGGLSPMATDSCGPDDCSSALVSSLDLILGLLKFGGMVTVPAWIATWGLPRTRRWSVARAAAGVVALVPPVLLLCLVLTLPAP